MADTKISALPSGAPAQAGDEYVVARSGANYKLTLTNIAGNMPATTISSGNLTFSSTAQRITGDLSNSPAINRLAIQSNVTNGSTNLLLLPNGTATTAAINFSGNSSRTNTAIGTIAQTATSFNIEAGITGTGSYVPVVISAGGAEAVRVDTSRRVGVGGGAPASEDRLSTIGTLPSSSNNSTAVAARGTVPSTTTSLAVGVNSNLSTDVASFTVSELNGVRVGFSLGAGSSVTNMMGVKVTSAFVGATNAYGVYSDLAADSGRWNFYAAGTARNYFAGGVEDAAGKLRAIPRTGSAKTTNYTLATTDVGLFVEVGSGGSITIPDATFSAGDVVSIFNNTTGNVTLTCSITTAYIAGTDTDKASVTLATRGVATVLFISNSVCVLTGNVS